MKRDGQEVGGMKVRHQRSRKKSFKKEDVVSCI